MPIRVEHDGSIAVSLHQIRETAGLEGIAIVDLSQDHSTPPLSAGFGGVDTIAFGQALLVANPGGPSHAIAADRRPVLTCPWLLPPARRGGLLLWRGPNGRAWAYTDHGLAASITMLLLGSISASVGQIGIDRLTGIPNRRWFIDETDRRIERLDRDDLVGTLCLIDVDDLRRLNTEVGREEGDRVLIRLASGLRSIVRPADLVARVGPDEFAIWQDGMDHMTAAERAEILCSRALFGDRPTGPDVKLSIGIASRVSGSAEDVRTLLRRAHMVAREVKAQGGGGWRVSRAEPGRRSTDRTG